MRLSTVVNVDVPMSPEMLDALSIFETFCVAKRIESTSEAEAKDFILQKFGANLADEFRPEYLLNSRAHAELPR